MCGDVNVFFHEYIPEDYGEIEIMIAETSSRRKGLATLSLKLMMDFCHLKLGKSKFIAKINMDNLSSINLFNKKM